MMARRVAAVIGGTALLAAWFGAAATRMAGLPPPDAAVREPVRSEPVVSEAEAQARRLRERLSAAPVPREPGRNPFRFAETRPATRPERLLPVASVDDAVVRPRPEPAAAIVGIAEHRVGEETLRTAVIRLDGELYFLNAGEEQAGYRVTAIGADAAELVELATGRTLRLALR